MNSSRQERIAYRYTRVARCAKHFINQVTCINLCPAMVATCWAVKRVCAPDSLDSIWLISESQLETVKFSIYIKKKTHPGDPDTQIVLFTLSQPPQLSIVIWNFLMWLTSTSQMHVQRYWPSHLCIWDLALFLSQVSDWDLTQLPARPLFRAFLSSLLGHSQD